MRLLFINTIHYSIWNTNTKYITKMLFSYSTAEELFYSLKLLIGHASELSETSWEIVKRSAFHDQVFEWIIVENWLILANYLSHFFIYYFSNSNT